MRSNYLAARVTVGQIIELMTSDRFITEHSYELSESLRGADVDALIVYDVTHLDEQTRALLRKTKAYRTTQNCYVVLIANHGFDSVWNHNLFARKPDAIYGLIKVYDSSDEIENAHILKFQLNTYISLIGEEGGEKYKDMFPMFDLEAPDTGLSVGFRIATAITRLVYTPKADKNGCVVVAHKETTDNEFVYASEIGTIADVCGGQYYGAHAMDPGMSLEEIKAHYDLYNFYERTFCSLSRVDAAGISSFIVKAWKDAGLVLSVADRWSLDEIKAAYRIAVETLEVGLKQVPVGHDTVVKEYASK